MIDRRATGRPEQYWERAGKLGYAQAMYSSAAVEHHVRGRVWNAALDIADQLGVPRSGRVLDLGCGDGAFAIEVLARCYREVDGYDKAEAAIDRARTSAHGSNLRFVLADLVALPYAELPRYDAVFMMGFLHHVKAASREIIRKAAGLTGAVVVLEPNGDNLLRKALEFTPSYRSAGEDSFTTRQLEQMFADAGFRAAVWRRMNMFPNFTPGPVYRLLAPLEHRVESSRVLDALCTVNMFGFKLREPGGTSP